MEQNTLMENMPRQLDTSVIGPTDQDSSSYHTDVPMCSSPHQLNSPMSITSSQQLEVLKGRAASEPLTKLPAKSSALASGSTVEILQAGSGSFDTRKKIKRGPKGRFAKKGRK
jgi:ABC-type molybdate transport system substrate-binding protein